MSKYGFVYIWYDRKRKMYYIGSHWGTEDDGYICSSNRMRNAYRRRPQDFRRRILSRTYSSKSELMLMEDRWLSLAKDSKERYYNLQFEAVKNPWWNDPDRRLSTIDRISKAHQGKTLSEEHKAKLSAAKKGKPSPKKGSVLSEEQKRKLSEAKKGNKNRLGKSHSQETKDKISETMRIRREEKARCSLT